MKLAGLRIGAAVGHGATAPGTLGVFVRDRKKGWLGILSNNHVLAAANKGTPGDPIKMSANGAIIDIGHLERAVELKQRSETDAAFARLSYEPEDVSTISGALTFAGSVASPSKGLTVWKRGSATGLTSGEVRYAALPELKLDYGHLVCAFQGLIGIAPPSGSAFSASGDSGSLVVTPNGEAVGLIVGGEPLEPEFAGLTLVAPIGLILEMLDLDLVH